MIGHSIAHYRILRKLGEGGMGEVFLAEDTELGRQVAIKALPEPVASDESLLARIEREAQILASLSHPNINSIFGLEREQGRCYLILEFVPGESLAQRLARERIRIDRGLKLLLQVAKALEVAHENGIVHRDLKPANVMVDARGHVKVLDFGLAKQIPVSSESDSSEAPTESHQPSRHGTVLGTKPYMSPEQLRGMSVDQRSDIWAFGCVLFEVLSGRRLFKQASEADLIAEILEAEPDWQALPDATPPAIRRLLQHCLRRDRHHRLHDIADARIVIEEVLARGVQGAPARSSGVEHDRPPTSDGPPGLAASEKASGAPTIRSLLLVVVLSVGALLMTTWLLNRADDTPEVRNAASADQTMVTILPFRNLGPPSDQYFADGITEELTTRLGAVSSLGIIAYASASRYREDRPSIQQIGEELGVDYVVEGTVRWDRSSPRRMRITPRLVRVMDGRQLWSEAYEGESDDIFKVQTDVSEKVIGQLGVGIADSEREAVGLQPTRDLEAYSAYLRGVDLATTPDRERDRLLAAVQALEEAVRLDPDFALAFARLSRVHSDLYWTAEPTEERILEAKRTMERAFELVPDLPQAQLAEGFFHYYGFRDYEAAQAAFQRAERQLPNDPQITAALGFILRRQGRFDEALASLERAVQLDPLSASNHLNLGLTLQILRRHEEADRYYDRSLTLDPPQAVSHQAKMYNYVFWTGDTVAGRTSVAKIQDAATSLHLEALLDIWERDYDSALRKLSEIPKFESPFLEALIRRIEGVAHARLGHLETARERFLLARELQEAVVEDRPNEAFAQVLLGEIYAELGHCNLAFERGRTAVDLLPVAKDAVAGPGLSYQRAVISVLCGEHDAALDLLEQIFSIPSGTTVSVPYLRLEPAWDGIRDSPRFKELLRTHDGEGGA